MWKQLFHPNNLLEDLLSCLNSTEMTRRHFREIARVAGLISATGRTTRQTQASAGLIYDVLLEHDGNNMLLSQARREVLEQQFEFQRLSSALESISSKQIRIMKTSHITPLAFPIWATLVQSRLSTHNWLDRITAMAQELECSASPSPRTSS
jgi:ATP-dependent Lhr-like helicase